MAKKYNSRQIPTDERYNSKVIAKFINYMMYDGKKSLAQRIVYKAIENVAQLLKMKEDDMFHQAVERISPNVEVKSKRVGGATYQIPRNIVGKRRTIIALRNLRNCTRNRPEYTTELKLEKELLSIFDENSTSHALQLKENIHKKAESNKAFSRMRWS